MINGLKSDRNNSASNIIEKMTMKRKQSANIIENSSMFNKIGDKDITSKNSSKITKK